MKQLKKDIERDRLIVNGKTINGSISKLEGCFSSIGDAMDNVLIECNLPLLSREGKELLTFCALRNIARTHSGGVTFQALQATLDINSTIIVPLSASALPLRILVAVGSFPKKSIRPLGIQTETDSEDDEEAGEVEEKDKVGPLQDWGLKCFIQATTVFNLKAVANASDENIDASQTDLKVRAVYDDAYYISINPKASEISLDEVASCIASSFSGGKVTILPCPQDGDEHLLKTS